MVNEAIHRAMEVSIFPPSAKDREAQELHSGILERPWLGQSCDDAAIATVQLSLRVKLHTVSERHALSIIYVNSTVAYILPTIQWQGKVDELVTTYNKHLLRVQRALYICRKKDLANDAYKNGLLDGIMRCRFVCCQISTKSEMFVPFLSDIKMIHGIFCTLQAGVA
ncbi:hypothetical protein BDF20DRAFT_988964 [Mycotypha africana]|uniref:uncharacterized protein n=1 Tax=Mycotypha africana TaxID=64632 RepID=UPI002301E78F|nr:uncharacterized protein BDF20DRAFT_988964 [Mycotypha africana]KAI8975488.1 hypothetical protein BDF20DRAFT_988964 [Mycotypha africana]